MPNAARNAVTAPDDYTPASTFDTGNWLDHVNFDVTNQPIYWQVKQVNRPGNVPNTATWGAEVYMLPGSRSIYRGGLTGARFRAAISSAQLPVGATQALVTMEIVT